MRFSTRLGLVVSPLVILPSLLAALLLFASTRAAVRGLFLDTLDLEMNALESQSSAEAELLDRLGVASSPFYTKSAERKLVAYAVGRAGQTRVFMIVDAEGRLVLGPVGAVGEPSVAVIESLAGRGDWKDISFPLEGRRYVGCERTLFPWGWKAYAMIDSELPARSAAAIVGPGFLFLLAGALAAALAARVLARGVSRPVEALAEATRRMGAGDLEARAAERGDEELRSLASSFNDMARRLAETNAGLEATVASRTEELRVANEGLRGALGELREANDVIVRSEKLAALGQLAAGLAHELNTPIGAIVSSNRSLGEVLDRELAPAMAFAAGLDGRRRAWFLRVLELGLAAASGPLVYPERSAARAARRSLESALAGLGSPRPEEAAALAEEAGVGGAILAGAAGLEGLFADDFCEAILERAAGLVAARRLAQVVESASGKAVGVVGALRGYLVPSANAAEAVPVDLAAEIETVLVLLDHRIKHGVRVERRLEPGLRALGEPGGLGQVWMNLVTNALQAMEYDGLLEISAERRGPRAVVSVADDGPGIPDAVKPRLFEPFFTTKKQGEGIGLGLEISRRIVERCGGTISFSSEPGRTVFTVDLPLAASP